MIQRKQSLLLLIVILLVGLNLYLPTNNSSCSTVSTEANEIVNAEACGIASSVYWLEFVLLGLAIFCLFLYKKQKVQVLLAKLAIVTHVALFGILIYSNVYCGASACGTIEIPFAAYALLISFLALFFVVKWINNDIKLISSLNRLR